MLDTKDITVSGKILSSYPVRACLKSPAGYSFRVIGSRSLFLTLKSHQRIFSLGPQVFVFIVLVRVDGEIRMVFSDRRLDVLEIKC